MWNFPQCEANTTASIEKFRDKRNRNYQLNRIEQRLFWNLINGNWGYVQLFIVWIFLYLYFTKNLDVQAARLHNVWAVQPLDTVLNSRWRALIWRPVLCLVPNDLPMSSKKKNWFSCISTTCLQKFNMPWNYKVIYT